MIEEKNAKITKTFLGFEDHGLFTFFLHLDYGSSGQGAGGYVLGRSVEIIKKILEVVGVNEWEELPGKFIRVKAEHGKVHSIRNIIKGEWLNFDIFFEKEG